MFCMDLISQIKASKYSCGLILKMLKVDIYTHNLHNCNAMFSRKRLKCVKTRNFALSPKMEIFRKRTGNVAST